MLKFINIYVNIFNDCKHSNNLQIECKDSVDSTNKWRTICKMTWSNTQKGIKWELRAKHVILIYLIACFFFAMNILHQDAIETLEREATKAPEWSSVFHVIAQVEQIVDIKPTIANMEFYYAMNIVWCFISNISAEK